MILAFGLALFLAALATSWLIYRIEDWVDPPQAPRWIAVLTYGSYAIAAIGFVWIIVASIIQHEKSRGSRHD